MSDHDTPGVTVRLPVRPGWIGTLHVPADLTAEEADRLCVLLRMLVLPRREP